MSPQEYIDSGILEAYALGAADPAEQREVEAMCARHPEVRAALDAIRDGLEVYATQHAVQPDPALRDKILRAASVHPEPKVIPLQPPSSRWKMLAIAASVVLVLSIGANIYFFTSARQASEEMYAQMKFASDTLSSMSDKLARTQANLDSVQRSMGFFKSPGMKNIMLATTDSAKPMVAMVHWNTSNMMIAVDPMTLPETAPGEKYVLWAIVNGTPVNEGSFTVSDSSGTLMLDTVAKAEAFAISLEKDGNVTTPAGPVYVMGTP